MELFNDIDLKRLLGDRLARLRADIAALPLPHLVAAPERERVDELVQKHRLRPVRLRWKDMTWQVKRQQVGPGTRPTNARAFQRPCCELSLISPRDRLL